MTGRLAPRRVVLTPYRRGRVCPMGVRKMDAVRSTSIPQAILEAVQEISGQQVDKILESVCNKIGVSHPNQALQKEILAHWQGFAHKFAQSAKNKDLRR